MKVCITGGTGSLGQALTQHFLRAGAERVVVLSRDEVKQAEMAARLNYKNVRFFLGDVRDRGRLPDAFWGCDTVIHCAALKRVDAVAYNPTEVRKTNIEGSANVLSAALEAGVKRVLMISSDKACSPTNIYGISKAAMEHEAVAFNSTSIPRGMAVSCVRYGNVLGSRGSVVHLWRQIAAEGGTLPLTSVAATRFWLTLDQAVTTVVHSLDLMQGGEIFVPVLPAMYMAELATAVAPEAPVRIVGLRPGGEKIHETLINDEEARRTLACDDAMWMITPHLHPWRQADWTGEPFPAGFIYASDRVAWRLSVDDMKKMLEGVV
jgi:UDP-N-acetylglucosamine 4,6-dehydratase